MFAQTTIQKKIVCLGKISSPPSKKIMVRPLIHWLPRTHGDAHYHDVGGKLNNERSALLFRLLFRKIEHMRIFRVEHIYIYIHNIHKLY